MPINYTPAKARNYFLLFYLLFLFTDSSFAQKQRADSLEKLLAIEKIDTSRVKLLWNLADAKYIYDPETAILHARQGVELAREIDYTEGESRSLGVMANAYFKIGNYPRCLEYNLQKLKIEEKRENKRNLSSVLMNIGLVHAFQEEYRKAMGYYFTSDSVIKKFNVTQLKPHIALNIGDTYDKLNILDSAFLFYNTSFKESNANNRPDISAAAQVGMAHIYRKQSNFILSRNSYRTAIQQLMLLGDDEVICEAEMGLSQLYDAFGKKDSAIYHALVSYRLARQDRFESRQLDAAKFLNVIYKSINNTDSAYKYLFISQQMNDSLNNKSRIRETQIMTSNEQLRQIELAENKKKEEKLRSQQLQLLFIGIFIPGLFLVTLLLSRIKLNIRFVKLLGILSLLIFFEYLTLLLHPTVANLTNHTPVFEILIFVGIAALLIPLHHRAEHWLINKLLHRQMHGHEMK